MLDSDLVADHIGGVLRESLAATSEELLFVNPSKKAIEAVIGEIEHGSQPPVRLFVDEEPLKTLVDDFLIASSMAEFVATGTLQVRILDSVQRASVLCTDGCLVSIVPGPASVAGLTTTDRSFVSSARDDYEQRWQRAEKFQFRTPPLSRIDRTLAEEFGEKAVTDFDRALATLDTARGNGEGLEEVTIALLIAANNRELLYDISRWGEDIGLASKATFSRAKNQLEEHGLIDTEKVPIDIGRPRLRLILGDDKLERAPMEAVIEQAVSTLEDSSGR